MDTLLLAPLRVSDDAGQPVELGGELQRGLLALIALAAPAPMTADSIQESLRGNDPIPGTRLFLGRGLTQTARIEPRTPKGKVYVTDAVAALAALSGDESFVCHYVGRLPTAKGYGKLSLHALHRRDWNG